MTPSVATRPADRLAATSPWWWLIAAGALTTALASLACTVLNCRTSSASIAAMQLHPWAVRAHVVLGPVVLALGVLQFYRRSWQRDPQRHGRIGRWYVSLVLALAMTGFILARTASGGTLARAGFFALALATVATTVMTYFHATGGVVGSAEIAHEAWAMRSYALLYTAITWPLVTRIAHVPVRWAAWLSWVPSLATVECYRAWQTHRRWQN